MKIFNKLVLLFLLYMISIFSDNSLKIIGVHSLTTEEVNPITLNSDTNSTDDNSTFINQTAETPTQDNYTLNTSIETSNSIENPTNSTEIIVIPETDFEPKEDPSLVIDLVNLNKTDLCITRFSTLLSFMTNAEQTAFTYAYKAIKLNETSIENTGRCFAPGYLKRIFVKIVKGTIGKINSNLTAKSRQIRNSFSCIKKSFDKNKSKGNFNKAVKKVVNAQANSNKCLTRFLKVLYETLLSRRRYLLLKLNDINSTGIIENNTLVGFPWLDYEMNNITSSFLNYAECYQDFPNSMVESYSEIQAILSQDPSCSLTTNSGARLLQKNTDKSGAKPNSKDDTKSKDSVVSTSSDIDSEEKDNAKKNDKVETKEKGNPTEEKDNAKKNDKVETKEKGNQTDEKKNEKTNAKNDININKSDNLSGDKKGNSKNSVKSIDKIKKNTKKSGISSLVASEYDLQYLINITNNYQNLTEEYVNMSSQLIDIVNNFTSINSKCNYISQLVSFMDNNKSVKAILNSELNKLKKNYICSKPNYLIKIISDENSVIGNFTCSDSEYSCSDLQNIEIDKTTSKSIIAFGCSEGKRFGMAYSISDLIGNHLEFYSYQYKSCKIGANSNCAKNIKNLSKKKSLRLLQILNVTSTDESLNDTNMTSLNVTDNSTDDTQQISINTNECLSPIKKACQDSLDSECSNSKLYQFIGELSPSNSGSPLPDDCKNIDLLNPDYLSCFNWINDNLIKFTLFPNITAIMNIQQLILNSQNTSPINNNSTTNDTTIISEPLRNLQFEDTNVIIVKEDASTKDTYANIPSEIYTIPNQIMIIDGSTPLESANINNQASYVIDGNTVPLNGEITTSNLNNKENFLKIYILSVLLVLIFAL